ncbi:localization factor PodJL [Asticcacaulis solisilvae]|nr:MULTISPECIES: SEL1-like repeat protein [Asticcacaulis]MBP2158048.1 localization factor PodJL [Asticcacaulis solisilvae]MDR6799093.1 localization factor PodJL [Asticcacaulis sp. BE141]
MSANAPWSVKGIDAKAREVAKDLARRSGMTLGEWLNQMILEGEDVGAAINREREREQAPQHPDQQAMARRRPPVFRETHNDIDEAPRRAAPFSSGSRPLAARELSSADLRRHSIFDSRPREDDDRAASAEMGRVASALESLSARIEGSESRSANAVRGVSSAVESLLGRLERSEAGLAAAQAETRDRLEEHTLDLQTSLERHEESREALSTRLEQAERLIDAQAERLEGLSGHLREEREHVARLETQLKNPAVQETVRTVEGALGKLANQLYEGEQRHRDVVKDVREDMVGLSHRLAQLELRDPERAAQSVIDKVVARMAERLEQAEARTSTAIRALEQAFTTLDARLNRAEERGDVTDPEQVASLKRLASDLSRRVDDSRAELMNALQDRSAASADQLLRTLSERVDQSERRSAQAIERLGQDVLRVADTINRRVAGVEAAQDSHREAFERIGREVGRVQETVDQRFGRTETSHAQALERLGSEIARISERLSQRMAESERRVGLAVEGVGQVIEQHRDQSRSELGDRIRQSEERTAKLLEEARSRIDQKLAQVQTQSLLSESGLNAAPRKSRPAASDLPNPFAFEESEGEASKPAATQQVWRDEVLKGSHLPDDEALDLTGQLLEPVTAPQEPMPAPVSITKTESAAKESFAPDFDPFIEEDLEYDLVPVGKTANEDESDPFADIDVSKKTAPRFEGQRFEGARAAAAPSPRTTFELDDDDAIDEAPKAFGGRDFVTEDADGGVSVSTRDALAAARAAVRATMIDDQERRPGALSGLGLKPAARRGVGQPRAAKDNTVAKALQASAIAVVIVGAAAGSYALLQQEPAAGTVPQGAKTPVAAVVTQTADEGLLRAKYQSATRLLDARAPGAVEKLQEVANQGYAPAQFMLSGIYSGEGNYVDPNPQEARKWAQRAADGGVARAMFNLGTMYYNGTGGPRNQITAAMWFRRAAERGVSDSQYNLGLLYAQGDAMPLNPAEAYKWFTIAAEAGDKDAAREAAAIRDNLTPDQRQKAEAAAAAFEPLGDGAASEASTPARG